MAFTDHKISAFAHKISDLADQPNLPPDELKARFDSSPEELRVAHNALCDDADRLDERVTGIVAGTFTDTITEDMLSDELRETIDNAAAGGAVTEQIEAETAARTAADTNLQNQIDDFEFDLSRKLEMFAGGYLGTGATSQDIYLGWKPTVVIIMQYSFRVESSNYVTGGMMMELNPIMSGRTIGGEVTSTGFRVYQRDNLQLNTSNMAYSFLAIH